MKIAIAQTDAITGNFSANLSKCAEFAERASAEGADLVLFPEMFLCGFDYDANARFLKNPAFDIAEELGKIARENSVALCGSVPHLEDVSKPPHNRLLYFSADGRQRAHYDKLHLFGLFNEDRRVSAGSGAKILETPFGKIGFAICYDLRFPELFRALALAGAQVVLLPCAWPYPRKAHFETLCRARAIENQCYVVAANRAGVDELAGKKIEYFGSSAIIDPWGDCIALAPADIEGACSAQIDFARIDEIRAQIPVLKDINPAAANVEVVREF